MADSDTARWVSAADAADAAGLTPDAVRAWADEGVIVSQVSRGFTGKQVMVRLDDVLAMAKSTGRGPDAVEAPEDLAGTALAPVLKSIPDLIAQTTAAADRAARAETKVEFLSAHLAGLREKLKETEEKLQGVGSRYQDEIDDLHRRLREAEDRTGRAEASARSERGAVESHQQKIEALTAERAELSVKVRELEAKGLEVDELNHQLGQARERAAGLERLRDERVAQLESERDEKLAELRKELDERVSTLERDKSQLQAELDAVREEAGALGRDNDALKERISRTDESIGEREGHWKAQLEEATKDHENLRQRLEEAEERARTARAEADDLGGRLRQIEDQAASASRQVESETQRADQANARADELAEKEASLRAELDELRTQDADRVALADHVSRLKKANADLTKQLEEARIQGGRVLEVEAQVKKALAEADALRAQVAQATGKPIESPPRSTAPPPPEDKEDKTPEKPKADVKPPPEVPPPGAGNGAPPSGPIDWGPQAAPAERQESGGDIASRIWGEGSNEPVPSQVDTEVPAMDADPEDGDGKRVRKRRRKRRLFGRRDR